MFLWVLIATAFGQEHAALFVGNSYTAFNGPDNLAGSYKHLLEEGMPTWGPLEIHSHAPGGVSFEGHLQAAQASGPLHDYLTGASGVSQWDVVVLQDQSQVPSFPQDQPTYAASRAAVVSLAEMVVAMGGTPHLFQTWGRRNGDAQNEWLNPDFSTMQQNLVEGYAGYAGAIESAGMEVQVIPVGQGWQRVHDDLVAAGVDPTVGDTLFTRLYANDGSHPSPLGTYLAASIAYATISGQSPVGLEWAHPGISEADRLAVQAVAVQFIVEEETGNENTGGQTDTEPEGESPSPEDGDPDVEVPLEPAGCGCSVSSGERVPTLPVLGILGCALVWVRRLPWGGAVVPRKEPGAW